MRFALGLLVLLYFPPAGSAQPLAPAADVLDAFPHSLSDARGVVVVPGAIRTGVVPGGWAGQGVLFVRTERGWGGPISVTLGGIVRPRAGDEPVDLVIVLRTRRGLGQVVDGDGKLDGESACYGGRKFAEVNLEGTLITRHGHMPTGQALVDEMKSRLAALSRPVPEVKANPTEVWTLPEPRNVEAFLGVIAVVATWLTAFRRRKS